MRGLVHGNMAQRTTVAISRSESSDGENLPQWQKHAEALTVAACIPIPTIPFSRWKSPSRVTSPTPFYLQKRRKNCVPEVEDRRMCVFA